MTSDKLLKSSSNTMTTDDVVHANGLKQNGGNLKQNGKYVNGASNTGTSNGHGGANGATKSRVSVLSLKAAKFELSCSDFVMILVAFAERCQKLSG